MRRVHNAKDVVAAHEAEPGPRRLQVVDRLAHVALGAEDEGGEAVVGVLDVFGGDDLQEATDDLGVGEAGVAEDGAAGLEGLDDFVGGVAGEGEACGAGVDFHCAPEGLLRAGCHAGGGEGVLVVEGGRWRENGGGRMEEDGGGRMEEDGGGWRRIEEGGWRREDGGGREEGGGRRRGRYLSASSRMTIFCRPWGRVTFFWAKPLIRLRTTSIPGGDYQTPRAANYV